MTRAFLRSNLGPCIGLIVPPLLWAVLMQAGQLLPYVQCTAPRSMTALICVLAILLSIGATVLAWRSPPGQGETSTVFPQSFTLVRLISLGTGAIFIFAMGLQAMSSLVLSGCER